LTLLCHMDLVWNIVFFKREDFIVVRDPEGNLIEILQKAIGK